MMWSVGHACWVVKHPFTWLCGVPSDQCHRSCGSPHSQVKGCFPRISVSVSLLFTRVLGLR
jgi:hypothetical protein